MPGRQPRPRRRRTRHRRPAGSRSGGRSSPELQEPAERNSPQVGPELRRLLEQAPRSAVEARHLREHPQEARVAAPAWLGENPTQPAPAGVREPAGPAGDAHAHLGRLGAHVELPEQAQQVGGVGAVVVHDESAVDAQQPAVRGRDVVGVRMSAEPALGLEDGHVVLPAQDVGGGQPRHPGADDDGAGADGASLVHLRLSVCGPDHCAEGRSRPSRACRMFVQTLESCIRFVKGLERVL